MDRDGTTADLPLQVRLPNPFSQTVAPRRPTTTAAPGKPPERMARATTWSIFWSRLDDMPTAEGALEGSPPSPSPGLPPTSRTSDEISEVSNMEPSFG